MFLKLSWQVKYDAENDKEHILNTSDLIWIQFVLFCRGRAEMKCMSIGNITENIIKGFSIHSTVENVIWCLTSTIL